MFEFMRHGKLERNCWVIFTIRSNTFEPDPLLFEANYGHIENVLVNCKPLDILERSAEQDSCLSSSKYVNSPSERQLTLQFSSSIIRLCWNISSEVFWVAWAYEIWRWCNGLPRILFEASMWLIFPLIYSLKIASLYLVQKFR